MKYLRTMLIGLVIIGLNFTVAQAADDDTVYELRTYTANEGRLDDLNANFRDRAIELFSKHGIESIGYWLPVDKDNTLIYIVRHKSMAAAKQNWKNFIDDPDWKAIAEEINRNGAILAAAPESVYMTATDYSLNMLK